MGTRVPGFLGGCALLLVAIPAAAQTLALCEISTSDRRLRIGETRWRLTGRVELQCGDATLYSNEADLFLEEDRAVATGNVVFAQGNNRIAADRADFDIRTRLGVFYHASGIAAAQTQTARGGPVAGAGAPLPPSAEDSDIYFFGETVEKIGPKKYRITNGGFSTCVQPTPRWNLAADTIVLDLDHYTRLQQAIFSVKGVPMLYMPVMYYPTNRDERATGFLLPTYGISSLRGQEIRNAFFWAIDRSQDATFTHEWYSKAGQDLSGEYRYNFGTGSEGVFGARLLHGLDAHPAGGGSGVGGAPGVSPGALAAYDLRGSAGWLLPGSVRASAGIDYPSDIAANRAYNVNLVEASRNTRRYGANVAGVWADYAWTATFDHREMFDDLNGKSTVTGGSPRIRVDKGERPLSRSGIYYSLEGEYAHALLDRHTVATDADGRVISRGEDDRSLTRLDLTPQIRLPFKRWTWLTVNSSLTWKDTYYSRSLSPASAAFGPGTSTDSSIFVDRGLNRQVFTFDSKVVGPVFERVWTLGGTGQVEKIEHAIEPSLDVQRTSSIGNANLIVATDSVDTIVGTTQYTYGIDNRLYVRTRQDGARAQFSRPVLSVGVQQTYYSNADASSVDPQYATSFTSRVSSHVGPLVLSVRADPSAAVTADVRAYLDSRSRELQLLTANGSLSWGAGPERGGNPRPVIVETGLVWTRMASPASGMTSPQASTRMKLITDQIRPSFKVHTRGNRVGGAYQSWFDLLHRIELLQGFSAFYNAQCCGIAFEYRTRWLGSPGGKSFDPASALGLDRRFFLTFRLAGLGTLSPIAGQTR